MKSDLKTQEKEKRGGENNMARRRRKKKWGKIGAPHSAKRRAFLRRIARKRRR